jgi:hypothetical protein
MPESANDLISVLVGLVVLWFLLGALIRHGRLWAGHPGRRGARHRLAGRFHGSGSITR